MPRTNTVLRIVTMSFFVAALTLGGCTKKPNQEELAKLEQARSAAESAEKKLSELRTERMQLEQTLDQKKQELKQNETERDSLKAKTGK